MIMIKLATPGYTGTAVHRCVFSVCWCLSLSRNANLTMMTCLRNAEKEDGRVEMIRCALASWNDFIVVVFSASWDVSPLVRFSFILSPCNHYSPCVRYSPSHAGCPFFSSLSLIFDWPWVVQIDSLGTELKLRQISLPAAVVNPIWFLFQNCCSAKEVRYTMKCCQASQCKPTADWCFRSSLRTSSSHF